MEGIEFDLGDKELLTKVAQTKKAPLLGNFLMQLGVTDPAVANLILACVAALFFGIALFIYAGTMQNSTPKLSPDEVAAGVRALSQMRSVQNN